MTGETKTTSSGELKKRVDKWVEKLKDRDTYKAASAELTSIATSLPLSSLPNFLSLLPLSSDNKPPARKLPLAIVSLVSSLHGDSLSPHLSRLLSLVLRFLRDPDSSVRLSLVSSVSSLSLHVTKPPFSLLLKPFVDSLFTDPHPNSQLSSALCISAAIASSPFPDFLYLSKLLPRFEKLARSEGFKGRAALLGVIGSVVGVGPGLGLAVLKSLVGLFSEYLGSEDWAVRKGAAEGMLKMAVVERDALSEFKAAGLKVIEAKRYDKVKIVRETMNQLVEAWKEIPDITDEVSPPMENFSSSKEDASDGRYPPGSKNTYTASSVHKKPAKTSIAPTTTPKRNSLGNNDKRSGPAMFRKLDRKKPTDRKIETTTPSTAVSGEDAPKRRDVERDENVPSRLSKQELRRALFNQNEYSDSAVVISNVTEDIHRSQKHRSQKENEDLSLIYKQLGHIETQQADLLDMLQKFIGSSQTGMRALETRVHGLELTLDEISYDLSLSNKKMPNTDSEGTSCCLLPGAEFLSPKFWRKSEPRHSGSPFSSSRGMTMDAMRERVDTDNMLNLETRRFRMQGRNGFIVNPLADLHNDSHGISEVSSK